MRALKSSFNEYLLVYVDTNLNRLSLPQDVDGGGLSFLQGNKNG